MKISNFSLQPIFSLPGLRHQTLAGSAEGLSDLEIWMQTLESGAETPLHYHECEEVILVQSGSGRLMIDDNVLEFGPQTTVVIPPQVVHKIANTGKDGMLLIAALSETPARVFSPDGELIAVPWHGADQVNKQANS